MSRTSLHSEGIHENISELPEIEDRASYINFVVDGSLPITLASIREGTLKDVILGRVKNYILNGWPKIKHMDRAMFPYFLCKNELSVESGIVMREHRVVIPTCLQKRILFKLHKSHLGIVKCKADAWSRFWFPGIDKAIEELIADCYICMQLRPSPTRAPLAVWPYPQQPFLEYIWISSAQ